MIEFCIIVIIVSVERKFEDTNIQTIGDRRFRVGLTVVFALSAFLFYAIIQTTLRGVTNIQVASAHCLEDTPQQKHNSNDRIPLLRNLFSDKAT